MKYCEGRLVTDTKPHENKKDWLLVKLQGLAHLRVLTQAQYDALPESAPSNKTSCHYMSRQASAAHVVQRRAKQVTS